MRFLTICLLSFILMPLTLHAQSKTDLMGRLFGGPFELVDHNGKTVTDKDFQGQYMLIYFGYTYCPDICPTGLSMMASALDQLGPSASNIQPIFISVDPQRDSPSSLKDYVAAFHPRLLGASGSEAQVAQVAKAYRVHRSKVLEKDKAAVDYLVNHSSITYLMDRNGQFLTMFPHGSDPAVMSATIAKYIQ